jgi:hypothetical protein
MAEEVTFNAPLHLLRPSADRTGLVANPEACAALEAICTPITVVSIVGNQRGGKSTLMNLFHGRMLSGGFETGHCLDAQTAGLWVWPRPHPWQEGVTVLVVDTEGLDAPGVPQRYHWLLSAVAILMSDVFIYQSRGSIEQSQTERLDLLLRIAEQLGRHQPASPGDKAVASFFWLLRDHQLRLRRSPKDELLSKLDGATIDSLRRCFGEYDCALLPRPVTGDDQLGHVDTLTFEQLSSEFREEYIVLERRIFELLSSPRLLLGQETNGMALTCYIRRFLEAVDGGVLEEICQLPSQRDLLLQLVSERALKTGLETYRSKMEIAMPLNTAELLLAHSKAEREALDALVDAASSGGLGETFRLDELSQKCSTLIAEWGPSCPTPEAASSCVRPVDDIASHVPALRLQAGALKGGLFFGIWEKHAEGVAQEAVKLQKAFEQNMVPADSDQGDSKAYADVAEFWRDLKQSCAEPGTATHDAVTSLQGWAPEAGDRLVFALAKQDAAKHAAVLTENLSDLRCEAQAAQETLRQETSAISQVLENMQQDHSKCLDSMRSKMEQGSAEQASDLEKARTEQRTAVIDLRYALDLSNKSHTEANAESLRQAKQAMQTISDFQPEVHQMLAVAAEDALACRSDLQGLIAQAEEKHMETATNLQHRMQAESDAMASFRAEMLKRSEEASSELEKPVSELRETVRVLREESSEELRKSQQGTSDILEKLHGEMSSKIQAQAQDTVACRSDLQELIAQAEEKHKETAKSLHHRMEAESDAMSSFRAEILKRSEAASSELEKPMSELRETVRVLREESREELHKHQQGTSELLEKLKGDISSKIQAQVQDSSTQQTLIFQKELQEHRSDLSKTLQLQLDAETGMDTLRTEMSDRSQEAQNLHKELQEQIFAARGLHERLQTLEEHTRRRFDTLEGAIADTGRLVRLAADVERGVAFTVGFVSKTSSKWADHPRVHKFQSFARHSASRTRSFAQAAGHAAGHVARKTAGNCRKHGVRVSIAMSHFRKQGVVQTRRLTAVAGIHLKRAGKTVAAHGSKLKARVRRASSGTDINAQVGRDNVDVQPPAGSTLANQQVPHVDEPAAKRIKRTCHAEQAVKVSDSPEEKENSPFQVMQDDSCSN